MNPIIPMHGTYIFTLRNTINLYWRCQIAPMHIYIYQWHTVYKNRGLHRNKIWAYSCKWVNDLLFSIIQYFWRPLHWKGDIFTHLSTNLASPQCTFMRSPHREKVDMQCPTCSDCHCHSGIVNQSWRISSEIQTFDHQSIEAHDSNDIENRGCTNAGIDWRALK